MKDYYKILEVNKRASQQDIKAAYRKQALKFHPDVNKSANAHERFIEINEAYEILSDPEKKGVYDTFYDSYTSKQALESTEVSIMQSKYSSWQASAKSKAESYAKMSFKEFQYQVLDKLVQVYDVAKTVVKVILALVLLWYFFGGYTCHQP